MNIETKKKNGYKGYLKNKSAMDAQREKMKRESRAKWIEAAPVCGYCNKPLSYDKRHNKFCDKSCAAKYNNPRKKTRKIRRPCLHCGKPVKWTESIYCTKQCFRDHRQEKKLREIIELGHMNNIGNSNFLRRKYLRIIKPYVCNICGQEPLWNGSPMPLIMDHVNGDSSDHSLDNLRWICSNCDTQLPTYKSKNIGNGKRVRYRKVKALGACSSNG